MNCNFREFLESGAPCEVNVDACTMERTLDKMENPTHHIFHEAEEHIYKLIKNDCYPRFIRSEHYKNLIQNAIPPTSKRR